MSTAPLSVEKANVEQAVPFFGVANMEQALRFYVDGLGFKMKNKWIDEGKLRWCWLELGGARLMLQEFRADKIPTGKLGSGMSICFMCKDALALYDEFLSRNVHPRRPFVREPSVGHTCDGSRWVRAFL